MKKRVHNGEACGEPHLDAGSCPRNHVPIGLPPIIGFFTHSRGNRASSAASNASLASSRESCRGGGGLGGGSMPRLARWATIDATDGRAKVRGRLRQQWQPTSVGLQAMIRAPGCDQSKKCLGATGITRSSVWVPSHAVVSAPEPFIGEGTSKGKHSAVCCDTRMNVAQHSDACEIVKLPFLPPCCR